MLFFAGGGGDGKNIGRAMLFCIGGGGDGKRGGHGTLFCAGGGGSGVEGIGCTLLFFIGGGGEHNCCIPLFCVGGGGGLIGTTEALARDGFGGGGIILDRLGACFGCFPSTLTRDDMFEIDKASKMAKTTMILSIFIASIDPRSFLSIISHELNL